ncbi:hypothetical protein M011DRAFT_465978 [Sporormia fimetaria CBS 119925]|uniref:Uncharacterized protein n=1 Tax=Sporormia fimetaria CBS 119925 TaxID=1340428 RepID=A0A6A6VK84_9PLEO|nr:hypothetical protein M011DRAFT_465978 [Sporormia fimetaria CBS 119925]
MSSLSLSLSSDHDYPQAPRSPLPPPPPPPPHPSAQPSPGLSGPVPGQHTSPLRRFAVQPPRLTTALAPPQANSFLHTPASAISSTLPFSPYAPSPSTYAASPSVSTPMAMRTPSGPYNPQQWGRQGPIGGVHVPYAANPAAPGSSRMVEITGMEAAMPSPPPPYSPAHQNHTISQTVSASPHLSGQAFPPPQNGPTSAHSSDYSSRTPVSGFPNSRPGSMVVPQSATSVTSNPQFPPPPPRPGERSASRDGARSKFSLSAFRNRNAESSAGSSNIDALRINTSEAIARAPASPGFPPGRAPQAFVPGVFPESPVVRAPAARRAVSAGPLGLVESRTPIAQSPIPTQGHWEPQMPLPPPPPGPPPTSSRSQSLGPRHIESGSSRGNGLPAAPPTRRPGQSTLTPIPPTPIDWTEERSQSRPRSPAAHGLSVDTGSQAVRPRSNTSHAAETEDASTSSGPTASTASSTLYHTPRRDMSARGIRERRSESRAAKGRVEPSNNPWAQDLEEASSKPADLVIGTPDGSLTRRGAVTRTTPRSGAFRSPRSSQLFDDPTSSHSTPRLLDSAKRIPNGAPAPTPPFSPGTDSFDLHHTRKPVPAIPAKALPTPPLHSYGDDLPVDLTSQSGAANRSISQTSHLSESRVEESSTSTPRPPQSDNFAQASIERHRQFIEKEASAQSDTERLELFADFIVAESRIRRDRYSGAFDAMAGDILDLTRDLWRSYGGTGRRSATPAGQSTSVPTGSRSQASVGGSPDTRFSHSVPTTAASPASSVTNFTPHTEPASPASASSQRGRDQAWNSNFQPCLSPIPSMAMSTVPDEEDSRGRSASRWWEASNDGASSGFGRRVERSKRESKYMGLPKEARESLQWAAESQRAPGYRSSSKEPAHGGYGPNEYPPEKVGLHEEAQPSSARSQAYQKSPVANTPDPHKLDVSRLVTLPPPYPRHHPAVNNSHPDLASIRTNLRNLSDLEEVKTTKERFNNKIKARKEQESAALADNRAQLRYNIQKNVQNGVMSFGEAAQAEAEFEARDEKTAQEAVQNIFDTFQSEVANPLHALFCERITKVSASIEHLKSRLCTAAQEVNPNRTQEEGDEQPELLELLTLLKWLFECREQLHKEMFELEDERNDLYKDIIILPYVQSKNEQKVKEATDFFSRDAQDRKVVFEKEMLKRYEDFLNVIEANVTRGVEAQLSAFWDIAPGLLAVVQKVPQRLEGFDVLIPAQEYEETPIYHEFPLQYLYTLLAHSGRSAYQFIESQINLLCLLHEVKTGVMTASSRLLETQRELEGEDRESVDRETRAIRQDEERRLTEDLKDKVGLVESQWDDALGKGLEDCKSRVEAFLVEQGGWDDSLKE